MKLGYTFFFLFFLNFTFAAGIELQDTITYTFPAKKTALRSAIASPPTTIKVMRYKVSEKTKRAIHARKERLEVKQSFRSALSRPAAKQLGMGGVPVLNQGIFGTCVMFSEVAALNAALTKPDFASPLCALKLGQYAEKNAYEKSGWDGSFHRILLARFEEHGVMSMEQQRNLSCGGMTQYPTEKEQITEQGMSFDEYHQLSYSLSKDLGVFWTTLLDLFESEDEDLDTRAVINQIKKSIDQGNRVLMSTLLPSFERGLAGAVGSHHTLNDSWVLSNQIKRNILLSLTEAAHAMVITGYDDGAIAIDDEGKKHIGLFTLRNSWGMEGDKGNFYMSYDYFRVLGAEAIAIGAKEPKS